MKRMDVLVMELFQTANKETGEPIYMRRFSNKRWEVFDEGAWWNITEPSTVQEFELQRDTYTDTKSVNVYPTGGH